MRAFEMLLRLLPVLSLLPGLCLGQTIRVSNAFYSVAYDPLPSALSVTVVGHEKPFLRNVSLPRPVGTGRAVTVRDPVWGQGEAIEVRHPDGSVDRLALFAGLPFVAMRTSLVNSGTSPVTINRLQSAVLTLELAKPVSELKALGTGGLSEVAGAGSYSFLAVADPETRSGLVTGWLTHHRGSGVLFGGAEGDLPVVRARLDYGRLRLEPGATERLETLLMGWFEDARLGLEAYAGAVARQHDIHLPAQPTVYCTWYHNRASDERKLAESAAFAEKELAPYGFSVVQIDDGWQSGVKNNGPKKDFTKVDAAGPYPSGMRKTAETILANGLVPGIWFMPFAGTWDDPWFTDKQEMFATKDGQPFVVRWGGTCLDTTHPRTREYIRSTVRRIADWGYRYFKLDGLWTGMAARIRYINDRYLEDDLGESVLYDPAKTQVEAYRDGLRIVREAAGDSVYLLGCNLAQNMRTLGASFGLVDAMRVGPDNGRDWRKMRRGPFSGTSLYFLHGRVWHNDPDPLYVRDDVPLDQARALASWVTLSGQLNASSTDYAQLSDERLYLLRRTMPAHGLKPRPVDLFEHRIARVWRLEYDSGNGFHNDVVGLFNWDETAPAKISHSLAQIGLDPAGRYAGFDYWGDRFLGPIADRIEATLPGASCRIIALRRIADRPVLVGTSRHISQGAVDMLGEEWRAGERVLSGRSKVVGGDPYELRIWCPNGYRASAAEAATAGGKKLPPTVEQSGNELRVRLTAAANTEVEWKIEF